MQKSQNQTLQLIEGLCQKAYECDVNEIKKLFNVVGESEWSAEYPFLADAIKISLTWHKHLFLESKSDFEPGVYIIEYQTGVVKIGKTGNFKQRYQTLKSMASTKPARFHFEKTVNHSLVEQKAHKAFAGSRRNGEFFSIEFETAVDAVKNLVEDHT